MSKALHYYVIEYFSVFHSHVNSTFCSIAVVSFQGIMFWVLLLKLQLKKCKLCIYNFVKDVPISDPIKHNV